MGCYDISSENGLKQGYDSGEHMGEQYTEVKSRLLQINRRAF
jgi:hypothetical protein